MFRKTMCLSAVALVLSASLLITPSRAEKFDVQKTCAYIVECCYQFQRLENTPPDRAVQTLRDTAQNLRRLPVDGVEKQARVLVWRSAAFLDKAANLLERMEAYFEQQLEGGFIGGSLLGAGITSGDPLVTLFGLAIGAWQVWQGTEEAQALENLIASLDKEAQELVQAWANYLRWLEPHARQHGLFE